MNERNPNDGLQRFTVRAECESDADSFLNLLADYVRQNPNHGVRTRFDQANSIFPGHVISRDMLTIATSIPSAELRRMLMSIEDGHVMVETFAAESEFTGKRTFGFGSSHDD